MMLDHLSNGMEVLTAATCGLRGGVDRWKHGVRRDATLLLTHIHSFCGDWRAARHDLIDKAS